MRFNWQKLNDNSWGVKASGDLGATTGLSGQTVDVPKRDGSISHGIKLGRRVDSWNGGRASVYEVERNGAKTRKPEPCEHCRDRGYVPDIDDDGLDADGAPILRQIELACSCPAGRRWEAQRQQRLRVPVPAELRSLDDRECQRLISCIHVYVSETDGDAEIIELENKLREFVGQEPVDMPSYLKA